MPIIDARRRPVILGKSAGSTSHTGNTAETIKGTVTIPGGTMGLTGILRVTFLGEVVNNANSKIFRVRLGGIAGTEFGGISLTTGFISYQEMKLISNNNSQSAQKAWAAFGNVGLGAVNSAIVTGAVNTAIDQDLVFTIQNGNSGDTTSLHHWIVELIV